MRTFNAVILGFVLTASISITAVTFRPAYVKTMDVMNSTIYSQSLGVTGTGEWDTWYTVTDYLYWIIPAAMIIGIWLMVWVNAQQKEYVTAGVPYR